jgi:hypothetical protein
MSIDNLGQSGQNIELPEDLRGHIENARNNVTLMEAEHIRLQKLVQECKDIVNQKHIEKTTLETNSFKLRQDIEDLINTITAKTVELQKIEEKVESAKKVFEDIKTESGNLATTNTQKSAELDKREADIQKYEGDVNNRIQILIKGEADHAAKVEKLKRAIE